MKVHSVKDRQGEAYIFNCPGCEMIHIIPVSYVAEYSTRNGKPKLTWCFNGNEDKPTFIPSFKIEWIGAEPPQCCHCIIRDGELIYLIDSTHRLSGSRIKMKDME